jgi:UDP-sugar diphosphatase
MKKIISHVYNVREEPLSKPKFIHPVQIHYEQNGTEKIWEAVKSHDSVAVLLYHIEKKAFLLVKQFRPAVHLKNKHHGFTFELCAGILDKPIDAKLTAKEEIDEECGYDVDVQNIQRITSFYTCVGFSGTNQILYYAQIDESMKKHDGGGVHGESIELYFLPQEEAKEFCLDDTKPKTPGLMFAFYWFFDKYSPKAKQ